MSSKKEEIIRNLRAIMDLSRRTLGLLDRSTHKCEACGLEVRHNNIEHVVGNILDALTLKLSKKINDLSREK